MKTIASKHIISVEAFDKNICYWYVYEEQREVKVLGITVEVLPAGFYNTITGGYIQRFGKGLGVCGKEVFERPKVELILSSGNIVRYFPTYEQAVSFAEKITYLASEQKFIDLETVDYDPQPKIKEN